MLKSTLVAAGTAIALAVFVIGCSSGATSVPTSSTPAPIAAAANTPAASVTNVPTAEPSSGQPTPTDRVVLKVSANGNKGTLLTDARGMTLYTYSQDTPDTSDCLGDCAKKWLPLTVPQGVTPTSVQPLAGNIGVFERGDGTYQVLYNDAPLYTYSGDAQPGDTSGDGIDKQWSVVVLPSAAAASTKPAGAIDWSAHGFPTIEATQVITPGTASNFSAGAYSVFVPAGAFTSTVKLSLLTAPAANFQAHAPAGETPVFAFALVARDAATNGLIVQFNAPLILTVKDARLEPDSAYYDVDAGGNFASNLNGMQVQAGELTHPIDQTSSAWVITTPAPVAAATSAP
ncbi:MAG: hypothetical protein M1570_01065 [Chloroflexi bacterium]|nr:hypothetical protein [Chloroflexota bacterium]